VKGEDGEVSLSRKTIFYLCKYRSVHNHTLEIDAGMEGSVPFMWGGIRKAVKDAWEVATKAK